MVTESYRVKNISMIGGDRTQDGEAISKEQRSLSVITHVELEKLQCSQC